MAAPPADVQVALTILQAVGLLIPVVFIALRPFYSDPEPDDEELAEQIKARVLNPESSFSSSDDAQVDSLPDMLRYGLVAVGVFGLAGVFSGVRVILWAVDSWLIVAAMGCLVAGLFALGGVLYHLRQEFYIEIKAA